MTCDWLTTDSFARLRRVTRRRAQQVLAGWREAPATAPRVRVVRGRRGRPALEVLAADVAALYAVDLEDLHQLAA